MTSLLAHVLPFALGAAVSPTLLTLELLILTGRHNPKVRAWAFVAGAAATLFIFGVLAAFALRNVNLTGAPSVASVAARVVLVVLLVGLGRRSLRPKNQPEAGHESKLRRRLADAGLGFFAGIGVLAMLTNFSTLVLFLPAMHLTVHADASTSDKWLVGTIVWLIAITPLVLPVLVVMLFGHRSDALLARASDFTAAHSKQISAGICFLFAALLAWSAVTQVLKLAG